MFANRKIPGADITFFVVNQVRSKGRSVAGVMNANLGISFIAGQHFPTIFAHEAGHFLGRYMNNGEWNPLDHQADTVDKQRDLRMLMRDGGSGWMIPFELVKKSENFPTNRPPISEACLPIVLSGRLSAETGPPPDHVPVSSPDPLENFMTAPPGEPLHSGMTPLWGRSLRFGHGSANVRIWRNLSQKSGWWLNQPILIVTDG